MPACRDLGFALRKLRKSPGFAITAILTLALGIGASTAVFTLVDSVLLKPLAYRDSGRLVAVWERARFLSPDPGGPNPRHFRLWQKRATAFSGLTLIGEGANGVALGKEHPQLTGTVGALPNLFQILQVTPLLGRTFGPSDAVDDHDHVAVVTYPLWKSLFHGDPHVIGRTFRLNNTPLSSHWCFACRLPFPGREYALVVSLSATRRQRARTRRFRPAHYGSRQL